MSVEKVYKYFSSYGIQNRIKQFEQSSATVELAAAAIGCDSCRIAKTMSFEKDDKCILVVVSGDAKIDNSKFKAAFGMKAKMLHAEDTERIIGHAAGGICPFAINDGIEVYLDISLKRFESVFPACGSSNSVIELSTTELETLSHYSQWVDVCKCWL